MRTILSATALLILAITLAGAAALPTITVRPECEIAGSSCTLGDAASVQSGDAALTQRLKNILVCPTPLPGKTRMVTRDQIVIALRRAGVSDQSVQLLCPAQVILRRGQSTVTGQALFDAAKAFAQSGVSLTGTVVIEPRRLPSDQIVPAGSPELRIKAGARSARKGQNSIPVEIVVDGQVYRTVMVSAMVRVVAPVLVATKTIAKSETISSVNTALQERDITTLSSDVMFEAPNADWTASVPISEGAVIRGQWVAAPAAVKSGDSVLVVVESGGVRVTEKGTAVQDGRLGDRIKVRFTGDVREARGIVAEPGVVKISLGRRTSK